MWTQPIKPSTLMVTIMCTCQFSSPKSHPGPSIRWLKPKFFTQGTSQQHAPCLTNTVYLFSKSGQYWSVIVSCNKCYAQKICLLIVNFTLPPFLSPFPLFHISPFLFSYCCYPSLGLHKFNNLFNNLFTDLSHLYNLSSMIFKIAFISML